MHQVFEIQRLAYRDVVGQVLVFTIQREISIYVLRSYGVQAKPSCLSAISGRPLAIPAYTALTPYTQR